MPGPVARRAGKSGRGYAADRRSWQYRDDEGPQDARTAHRAHHPGCADHRFRCAQAGAVAEWPAGGCGADAAGPDGDFQAHADDGAFLAGERGVKRSGTYFLTLPVALLLAVGPAKTETKARRVDVVV